MSLPSVQERADLEEQRSEIVQQQNEFTIRLKELEDDLLQRLANAEGDVLGDEELILSLENTKVRPAAATHQPPSHDTIVSRLPTTPP